MLSTDPAVAARQLEDQLRATVQALEASRLRLTIPEHVHIIHVAANASAALGEGDLRRIQRSLEELGAAAAILARAGDPSSRTRIRPQGRTRGAARPGCRARTR
jgi:hypothetical protein